MGQISSAMDRVLEILYEYPLQEFTVRRLSRMAKLPKSTVHKYLSELKRIGMISKSQASDSRLFKTKKIHYFIERLVSSGLLDHLEKELRPSCIILFGSFRKGESDKESDIDLFVETVNKKEIQLSPFERRLKHAVHLLVEEDIKGLQPHVLNNVINGIKLSGSFKIR